MSLNRSLIFSCILFAPVALASNEQGTGRSNLRIVIEDSQRVIIENQTSDGIIIGSTQAIQGYGEMMLDQIHTDGRLSTSWGKAEVLLGCYSADIVIYQLVDESWQELSSIQMPTEVCLQP